MPRPQKPEALRDRYTWHLRPPFTELFNARMWWLERNGPKPDAVAALYELARRHPRVGSLRQQYIDSVWHARELRERSDEITRRIADAAFEHLGREPAAIHCLCLIGLKCWADLDLKDQEYWEMSAGKLKGVDCRDRLAQCSGLITDGFTDLMLSRLQKLKVPRGALQFHVTAQRGDGPSKVYPVNPALLEESQQRLAADFQRKRPRAKELETLVAQSAANAFRSGDFIFSVSPDLSHERAVAVFAEAYRREQDQLGSEPQRARWFDWLPALAQFERDERRPARSKAAAFTRYRRIIDGIDFVQRPSRLMKLIDPD